MLILNFAPAPPISDAQREQIRLSILRRLDERFVVEPLRVRVAEVALRSTVAETLDAIGLTPVEWMNLPIAPRIPADHPFAGALLADVNRRRGYAWPVIREVSNYASV